MLPKRLHVSATSSVESLGGEEFWAVLGELAGLVDRQAAFHVAVGWQIYELTSAPLPLGLTGVLGALPVVVVSLTGGLLSFVVVAAVAAKLPAIKNFPPQDSQL